MCAFCGSGHMRINGRPGGIWMCESGVKEDLAADTEMGGISTYLGTKYMDDHWVKWTNKR